MPRGTEASGASRIEKSTCREYVAQDEESIVGNHRKGQSGTKEKEGPRLQAVSPLKAGSASLWAFSGSSTQVSFECVDEWM